MDEVIQLANEKLEECYSLESENREEGLEDLRFLSGDQWPAQIKLAREQESRPCLTVNKLPKFVRQVCNDQRMNRPAIKVRPKDDGDVEKAEIYSGLIRHIEYASDADTAYGIGFKCAVSSAKGYFRILTDYEDEESFDQCIKVGQIENRFSVLMGPHEKPDGSDAEDCFILSEVPKSRFEAEYPNARTVDFSAPTGFGRFAKRDHIIVAEWFTIEREKRTLCLLVDGSTAFKDELSDEGHAAIVETRVVMYPRVKWRKMTGAEILEEKDWPGKYIPVVEVQGERWNIDGEVKEESLIRHSKDPQRMHNYWRTASTELVALAPKAPFVGAAGQFEGYEQKWNQANTRTFSYLEYNPLDINGQMVPPPQRQPFAGVPAGVINESMMASDDMKETTGIFDASLGQMGNEVSGKAILARQREGDTGTFHYIDNLSKSIRHAGRIMIDLIPKIYDTERVVRLLDEDGTDKKTVLNKPAFIDGVEAVLNDTSVGKFDVVVETGPSFNTKRVEAQESMLAVAQYNPNLFAAAGDLLVKSFDWPNADKVAARLRPPGVVDDDTPPEVMQAQQQLQQMGQQMQQMEQIIQQQNQQLQDKQRELDVKAYEAHTKRIDVLTDDDQLESKIIAVLQNYLQPPQ